MTWAKLARALDRSRIPISCAGALSASLYLTFSSFRWMGQTLFVPLILWFVLAFTGIIVGWTAALAVVEHLADRAKRRSPTPVLPFAIAEYREPEAVAIAPSIDDTPSGPVAPTDVAAIPVATDAPAFLKGPK